MKNRKGKASGGTNEMAEDAKKKNMKYTFQSKVNDEAEERKAGGRVARKEGGKIAGAAPAANLGRAARKSGGRAGSNFSPLSSAASGRAAPGRNVTGSLE